MVPPVDRIQEELGLGLTFDLDPAEEPLEGHLVRGVGVGLAPVLDGVALQELLTPV